MALSFRDRVVLDLKSRGLTIVGSAGRIGVSVQRVSEVLNGSWQIFPSEAAIGLAALLGMDYAKLLRAVAKERDAWLMAEREKVTVMRREAARLSREKRTASS